MKLFILLIFIAIIGCKSSTTALRPDYVFKEAKGDEVTEVTEVSMEDMLTYLASDELEGRKTGEEGIEKAAVYIEGIFKNNHIDPYFYTYRDTLSNHDETAFNVVGYIEGNDESLKNEFVIVGAHYDHIGTADANVDGDVIANGANDNATGTVAVIEVAKYFSKLGDNKRSILFVLFSAEEEGLLGSAHLAKKLKQKDIDIYTMINFEMIGVPMTTNHKAYLTGFEASNMASKINEYAGEELIGFLPKAKEYNLFKRSDNYPFFQEFGIPAQTISTFDFTNYSYYHHVDDESSLMNIDHMNDLINDLLPAFEKIVNSSTREIIMNE